MPWINKLVRSCSKKEISGLVFTTTLTIIGFEQEKIKRKGKVEIIYSVVI